MLAAAVLAAHLVAPSPERAAARVVDAIRSDEIRTLAGAVDPTTRGEWVDVIDVIERTRCASIDHYDAVVEFATSTETQLTLLIDGRAETAGAPHEIIAIPPIWRIHLERRGDTWLIRSAKTDTTLDAAALVDAADDAARDAILDAARDPRAVMRLAAEAMSRRPKALAANEAFLRYIEHRAVAAADTATVAYTRRTFSRALLFNHAPERAVAEARNAVDIALTSGDRDVVAEAWYGLGMARWVTGDLRGAVEAWNHGGDLVHVINDPRIGIKSVYMTAFPAEKYDGFAAAQRTEDLSRLYDWKEGIIDADFARGDAYRFARQNESAAAVYRAIAAAAQDILHPLYEQLAVVGIADADMIGGRLDSARAGFEKAWRDDYPSRHQIALSLGEVYLAQGEFARSREMFDWLVDFGKKNGDPQLAALGKLSIAESLRRQQRYGEALATIAEIKADLRQPQWLRTTDSTFPEWAAAIVEGQTLRSLGRTQEAMARLRAAIDVIESMRSEVTTGAFGRSHFFEDKVQPYVSLIELLVAQHRNREALALSEHVKARSLTEALSNGGVDLSASMTAAEREREAALEKELRRINLERLHGNNVEKELRQARAKLDRFTNDLYLRHPDLRAKRVEVDPDPLRRLPRGVAIVDYVVGESQTTAFVLDADREPRVVVLPIRSAELARRVKLIGRLIASRSEKYAAEARALHRMLIAPLHLPARPMIGIVPDDMLWELPFQVLLDQHDRPVVDRAAIFFMPSLTAFSRAMHQKTHAAPRRLLAIGNPRVSAKTSKAVSSLMQNVSIAELPDAEREVREIGKMYGAKATTVLTAGAARESAFKALAPEYGIVHVAAHALTDNAQPMFSCVVFGRGESDADDGILEARELIDMKLRASLAVLSACETAGGGVTRGEGIIGLSWAFLVAGCRTTVASQWNVASSSTAALMIAFHRNLLGGQPPPVALRNASRSLKRDPRYANPFYWAPFAVVGAPR